MATMVPPMIDMHVGFTGGELPGGAAKNQPSYFRAAIKHLQAVNHLVRGRVRSAAKSEWEATREVQRALVRDARRLFDGRA